jgi:dihydroxyacetone kinase
MEGAVIQAETELGRIDAVAGDGDHGRGMVKGVGAAVVAARSAADNGAGAQSVLAAAGEAWATKAGGTSGVLWGATLRAIGEGLRDDDKATSEATVADAIRAGLQALQRLGKAELGDKTMVDAFVPFVDTLGERVAFGEELSAAWLKATQVSEDAAQATAPLRPRIGRARPLAERSVGTPDAGAISFAMCVRAVAGVLASAR